MLHVKPQIAALSTYKPPWSHIDRTAYLRFDLNENTLPLPNCVKNALKAYIDSDRIPLYPDCSEFMPKLARYAQVEPEQLMVANGSDQAIEVVLRSFLGVGDELVMAQPGFPMFAQIAGAIGAKVTGIAYDAELRFPRQAFLSAIGPDTKLAVLVNPDNPTGASVSMDLIEEVLSIRSDLPVIVDEAYFEFTGTTSLGLLAQHPNLIVLRTFSKAFALGGLRLGYSIAHPDVTAELHKVRGPFDVNSCALIAAGAQLDDASCQWKQFVQEAMEKSKPCLEAFFGQHKVKHHLGAAHFMLVEPEDRDGAVAWLKERGILVRPMAAPAIRTTFRMNVGTLEQTKHFVEVYADYLRQKR